MRHAGKSIILLILIILLIIGVCGCTMDLNNSTNTSDIAGKEASNVTLTERQQAILLDQGLPTVYDKLTERQKLSITDIEEMLQAVETKYGTDFVYVNYTAEKELESGILTAYPAAGNQKRDMFTVERSTDGSFVDTYMCIAARDVFEEYLMEYVGELIGTENARVYSEIIDTSLTELPVKSVSLSGNTCADSWIFVDGSKISGDDFVQFTNKVVEWLEEKNIPGSVYVLLLEEDTLVLLTKYNYTDYLTGNHILSRQFCNITK